MIEQLIEFQTALFATVMLVFLYLIIYVRTELDTHAMKILKLIILVNIINLLVEIMANIMNGSNVLLGYYLNYFFTFLLFFVGAALAGLWVSYIDYKIFRSRERLQKRYYYMHGMIVMLVLLCINVLVYPLLFTIDPSTNLYSHGPVRLIYHFVMYSLFLYTLILVFLHREKIDNIYVRVVVLVFVIPLVGSFIDLAIEDAHLGWSTMALAVLVAYVFLETSSGERDYLTQVFSRQSLEYYLRDLEAHKVDFGLLMIDLNDFKEINDQRGHQVGDHVLKEFARLLQKTFSSDALVARYAGDEFIVVVKKNTQETTFSRIDKLKNLLHQHSDSTVRELELSYGYKHYEHESLEALFLEVDRRMYRNKEKD